MQVASYGTDVGRMYCYLTVLKKQVYTLSVAMVCKTFMTICDSNQQPVNKEKFKKKKQPASVTQRRTKLHRVALNQGKRDGGLETSHDHFMS